MEKLCPPTRVLFFFLTIHQLGSIKDGFAAQFTSLHGRNWTLIGIELWSLKTLRPWI